MKRDLASTFAVLQPDLRMTPVPVGPTVYEDLDRDFAGFKGCSLISLYEFDKDWSGWERHPAGDELVCLLSGNAEMTLEMPEGARTVSLDTPGSYVLVPRGTWHIARTRVPTKMLFVTPGQGTEHRPA